MRESRTVRRWAAPLVVALCIPAAGCTGAVSSWQVEASITTELHHLGVDAVDVRCPHDLQAVVGVDVWCSFVVAGQPVDAVVEGGRDRLRSGPVPIVPKARPIGRALLEQRLAGDIP